MKKNIKLLVASSLATSMITMSVGFAQTYNPNNLGTYPAVQQQYQPYQPQYAQQYTPQPQRLNMPALQGHVIIIPAGTQLPITVANTLSSEVLTVGDSVSLNLGSPFFYQGAIIAPANSIVNGSVVACEKAGRGGKHGKLKIKFTDIITPQGFRIPIAGKIKTEDNTGMLYGGTNKDRAKKVAKNTAVGAAGGALSGLIFGSASGGKAGKGAAVGTAIGSGLGLGKSLWDKGEDVVLNSGSILNIMIEQPITINPTAQ